MLKLIRPCTRAEIGFELLQALVGRDVERGERALIDEAADAKPVPDLEARQPVEKLAVEGRIAAGAGAKIAFDNEMRA